MDVNQKANIVTNKLIFQVQFYVCIYVYVHVCRNVCIYVCVHVCRYLHMMYMYENLCLFVYI